MDIPTNVSSCFQPASRVTLINIAPSATTEAEIADKAKLEFRKCDSPAERLRYACIASGLSRLKTFLRTLRKNPQFTLNELWQLTQKLSIQLTDKDLDSLIEKYSRNGRIDVERLTRDVRVPMVRSRLQLVSQIFDSISENQPQVEISKLLRHFCFKNDRDFVAGKKTDFQIVERFKKDFNLDEHEQTDGKVEKDDFLNYYGAMSFGANSDAYFDLYMRQTWRF
ncbi:hypothetical protein M3Y97_01021400 [Aphelenchoides bicaudatus]|nr:hypothetical protein M3Y97_01021400 [Aphelenchoides bicaudatus]